MRSPRFLGILTITCVLLVILPIQTTHASPTSYLPGVKVGDWVNYGNVQTSCEPTCPSSLSPGFKATTFTVANISGSNVTLNDVTAFSGNPTRTRSVAVENLDTGQGNLSQWFLVAGGLSPGGSVYNGPSYPTLNSTQSGVYVGEFRQANMLNLTRTFPNATVLEQVYRWDSLTGVLLEFHENSTSPSLAYALSYSLTGTSLWKYHVSIIDDGSCATVSSVCRFNPSSAPVIVGTTIEWDNTGQLSHTVTACSTVNNGLNSGGCGFMDNATLPSFDLGPIAPGANLSLTFNVPGMYYYFSKVYPWMDATVSVLGNATNTPTGSPDFSLVVAPTTFTIPPSGTWYHPPIFVVTSLNEFSGPLTLTSQVNPSDLEITLNTASPISGPTANLTLVPDGQNATSVLAITLPSTPPGNYTVTVTATSGTITHSANLTIILPAASPNFEIRASASFMTITQYSTASSTITLTSLDNFSGNVTLSAGFAIPIGFFGQTVQLHLSNSAVHLSANSTAISELTVGPLCSANRCSIQPGNYNIFVTASNGSITHGITIKLTVVPLVTIIGVSPNPANTGQTVIMKFSLERITAISSITVSWGDGTVSHPDTTASSATHIYLTSDYVLSHTYTINVTATSGVGVGFSTIDEVVNDRPPILGVIGFSPSPAYQGETVTLNFTASDPDGVVTATWVYWGDGSTPDLLLNMTSSSMCQRLDSNLNSDACTIAPGSLILAQSQDPSTIVNGSIIVFMPSQNRSFLIVHRVVGILPASRSSNGQISFKTMGDANVLPDCLTQDCYIPASSVIAVYQRTLSSKTVLGQMYDIHAYPSLGDTASKTYNIRINATDNSDSHSYLTTTAMINDRPPTATILSLTPSSATTGATVTLTFSASDLDGTVQSIGINWGDGTTSTLTGTATSSAHVYDSTGTFVVSITATDNAGLTTQSPAKGVTINPATSPATPATILGLQPGLFYSLIGAIVIVATIATALGLRSRRKDHRS